MSRGWNVQSALTAAGLPQSLVTPTIAAEYLGLSLSSIRSWITAGKVKAWRLPWGNRYYIDLAELLIPVQPDTARLAPIISSEARRKQRERGQKISVAVRQERAARMRLISATTGQGATVEPPASDSPLK